MEREEIMNSGLEEWSHGPRHLVISCPHVSHFSVAVAKKWVNHIVENDNYASV